ncbi:LysR family transcriptional regulator [Parasedimentitalea maritima]|uniref:LysR family transcriptional regulator n=1 Tax=Parasedimentitalea maritima TaxID=2578117 RepID=A0ABY2V174_9RHOB|nr:LysR family transcriptional regulator [Zongyanglinia marina]TLP69267.1 LysR family transcriptional regulator [Zongyanglinia marina]
MDLSTLNTLLLVAQQGSLAGAARVLDLDPSSVSRTLATAEAELGLRIFQRSTRRLNLTEEGESYLTRIAPLVQELELANEEARAQRQHPVGPLRISASVAFGQVCMLPLLPQFRAELPGIQLDLHLSDLNVDLVGEGIDIAIRLAPAPNGDLIGTRLKGARYHVCAAPEYLARGPAPNHPSDLAQVDCLRLSLPVYRSCWQFRDLQGAEVEVEVDGSLIISNPLALREAARLGLGPTLLADWLVADDLATGQLVDLFPNWQATATMFETGVWALYPSRSYLPARVRAGLDFFKAHL